MADLATLAIKVENGDVIKASQALGGLEVASTKSEAATQRLTRRMALLEIEARKVDAEMANGQAAARALANDLFKTADASAKLELAARKEALALAETGKTSLGAASAIRTLYTAIATGFAVREVASLSDAYTNLQSRLRLVTTGTGNLSAVQAELFQQAQRTRTSFEATVELYARMARSAGQVGASQRQMLQVTETVNKAMTISGVTAEAAQAALIQFGQALASNRLGGDELRSISEQAPRLAQAIAQGMGATVGDLKRLSTEGKLTADAVFKALIGQKEVIDREFAQMPRTIGGAMQQIKNEILQVFGESGGASAATGGIVTALDGIRAAIGPVARAVNAFFGGFAIAAADAALGLEKFRQKVAQLQLGIGLAIRATGNKSIGDALIGNATKVLKDGDDIVRMLEKQRDTTIQTVHAVTELGAVSTKTTKPPPVVDPNAAKDLAEQQKAMDAYYNALNQHQIDAINAAKNSRVQNDQLRDLIAAYGESEDAVNRVRVAQAGENAVRELGIGVSEKVAASVRREAEEHERLTQAVDKARQAQADREREAERAAEEAQRALERRAKELHRTVSSTIEGILTDIDNRKNPFVALFDNLKRGAIKAISDILASKIEGKVADFLGIEIPATKQEKAGKLMNDAADKMLRAAGEMNGTAGVTIPGGGGVQQSAAMQYMQKFLKIGGAAYGGFQTGYGIGAATGDKASGAIGGAVSGAVMGASIAGPVGAAVGGVAGFVGGLLGAGAAAKAAAERMKELREAFQNTFDSLRAELNKDTLGQAVAQVKSQYDAATKQATDAFAGPALIDLIYGKKEKWEEYKKVLGDLDAMEKKRIEQLEREAAVAQKRQLEDFQARRDAATPGNEAQEALDAIYRQLDREREDLVASFGDEIDAREAAILAMADQAFAAEKEKAAREKATDALNTFSTAVRNAPTGFKLEGYIQQFAKGSPLPGSVPLNPLTPSARPLFSTGSTTGTVATAPITVNVTVNESKTPQLTADAVTDAFLTKLDAFVAASGGINIDRSTALNRLPQKNRAYRGIS